MAQVSQINKDSLIRQDIPRTSRLFPRSLSRAQAFFRQVSHFSAQRDHQKNCKGKKKSVTWWMMERKRGVGIRDKQWFSKDPKDLEYYSTMNINREVKRLLHCLNRVELAFIESVNRRHYITSQIGDFLDGSVVENLLCNSGDTGLIPGWETKIPHAFGWLSPCIAIEDPKYHN